MLAQTPVDSHRHYAMREGGKMGTFGVKRALTLNETFRPSMIL